MKRGGKSNAMKTIHVDAVHAEFHGGEFRLRFTDGEGFVTTVVVNEIHLSDILGDLHYQIQIDGRAVTGVVPDVVNKRVVLISAVPDKPDDEAELKQLRRAGL